jgi:hypothetical protein
MSMRVRLIKKFAEMIDGIDLRRFEPGDILELERCEARLLMLEGWAVPEKGMVRRRHASAVSHTRAIAADRPR